MIHKAIQSLRRRLRSGQNRSEEDGRGICGSRRNNCVRGHRHSRRPRRGMDRGPVET